MLKGNTWGRYIRYTLYRNGEYHWESIHRLVLLTFVGPAPTKRHQGAHGDGDKSNNKLSNLRWASPKENSADRAVHGSQVAGTSSPNTRITKDQVLAIRELNSLGFGYRGIAAAVGIGQSSAARITRGETYR